MSATKPPDETKVPQPAATPLENSTGISELTRTAQKQSVPLSLAEKNITEPEDKASAAVKPVSFKKMRRRMRLNRLRRPILMRRLDKHMAEEYAKGRTSYFPAE